MTTIIPQRQLRNDNAEILDRVQAGESFTVTRNGVAVADVIPHRPSTGPPRFPATTDLMSRRRSVEALRPDPEAWLRDIRSQDAFLSDLPFDDPVDDPVDEPFDDPMSGRA